MMDTDQPPTIFDIFNDFRVLPDPEIMPPAERPHVRRAMLDEVWLAMVEEDGLAVMVTVPPAVAPESINAIAALAEQLLRKAGIPLRPRNSCQGPTLWLSIAVQPAATVRICRTRLVVLHPTCRLDQHRGMALVGAPTCAAEKLALSGRTEVPDRLKRDARALVRQFARDLQAVKPEAVSIPRLTP